MTESTAPVQCPKCGATFTADIGWRLATCPRCAEVVMRMDEDAAYD